MRHRKETRKLGRNKGQRHLLVRNLIRSVFLHGKIKVSLVRAKRIKADVEHIITLAKKGDLASRRNAIALLNDAKVVNKIFAEAEVFKTRSGGYTQILKLGVRPGDGCEMSIMQLLK